MQPIAKPPKETPWDAVGRLIRNIVLLKCTSLKDFTFEPERPAPFAHEVDHDCLEQYMGGLSEKSEDIARKEALETLSEAAANAGCTLLLIEDDSSKFGYEPSSDKPKLLLRFQGADPVKLRTQLKRKMNIITGEQEEESPHSERGRTNNPAEWFRN